MIRTIAALALTASLALSVLATEAKACAACGCGDPTLTGLGAEKPFVGRLRAAIEVRHRTDAVGAPRVDRLDLSEQRADVEIAWAPHERVFLQLEVPLLRREVEYVNLARTTSGGLGDIELRAKAFVYADRDLDARHLFSVVGGLKLPTALVQHDAEGERLPTELQPGTGSFDPMLGLSYAWFPRPWSLYVSLLGTLPTEGAEASRASSSVRGTVALQYAFNTSISARMGADTRLDGRARENGAPERDSGGFVAYASPELLVSPIEDLLLFASVRIPVVQVLDGFHEEGLILGGGVAYDF